MPTGYALALAAADELAPRLGRTLPAAVARALEGPSAPRSAIDGLAAHIVRVAEAVAAGRVEEGPEAVAALTEALPPVHGASRGVARMVTDAVLAARVAAAA